MSESHLSALKATVLSVLIAGFALYWSWPAFGHEWYSFACCDENDCRPLQADELVVTTDGYLVVSSGMTVPFGDARIKQSEDAGFHACFIAGEPKNGIRCLYVPTGV